ncbi:formimidoylglutamate deiminase [Arthrobacter sp. I2-34]|uniref:Formimidoylglutamate deiminase n=1 Tax=Arthrobacter hankyongi TaxID=2904801 RepID=A0ABS9L195_9MICC|nr:formimidoylglutamate deiminase [Arthrobacter hankyongi]MCG2620445.1 formimidoylglutamate deiminase [Arthrobacter hankyongi]
MSGVWCEAAWLPGRGVADSVRAEVNESGIVTSVRAGVPAAPADLHVAGVSFPAASNAHSHAFHRVLRGRTHDMGVGSFWTWREQMYKAAGALTPDLYEELATAVFAEMVVTGWTSVAEFHYVHHQPDGTPYGSSSGGEHAMELALARAAVNARIRLTLLDTCYLAGGIGQPLAAEQTRFGDTCVESWLERLGSLRAAVAREFSPDQVTVAAALHSVRGVPEEALPVVARELPADMPLHIHLSEQPAENEACVLATGLTPTGLLQRHGLITNRLSAVHATHLTENDIAVLGAGHTTIVMCPTTEADLADGIGPAAALKDAGARIALGTDQQAVVDPWLEMRALEHGERLGSGQRGWFPPEALHKAASDAGAAAQGRRAPGLAPGRYCDLMAVDPASMRTVGSRRDQLALTATAQDVATVVIGGRLAARKGIHATLGDPARLLSAALTKLDTASEGV